MKYMALLVCLLAFESIIAQPASQEALDEKSTLRERFQIMKAKSQTYGDYKVVKEFVLDGVWKMTNDSINTAKARFSEARTRIVALETELKNTQLVLQEKEASVQEIEYAGTHISVLGIPFEKSVFVTIVSIIIAGLIVLLALLSGKLKLMYSSVKEKIDLINTTVNEFEDYKRKALDRQTKLSRELQNERNKLTEIKRS
ncbi:hypothetical protein BH10BAC4_BH10BAC4_16240 [soil metagenome]